MPRRQIDTVLGIPMWLPGSEDWTDEEFEAWKAYEIARATWYDDRWAALERAGWTLVHHLTREHGRESRPLRARHPEHAPDWIPRDEAEEIQERLTPGFLPTRPVRPPNLPTQAAPLFEIRDVTVKPMEVPSFSLLNLAYKPPTDPHE
jgi:hypothetical protein